MCGGVTPSQTRKRMKAWCLCWYCRSRMMVMMHLLQPVFISTQFLSENISSSASAFFICTHRQIWFAAGKSSILKCTFFKATQTTDKCITTQRWGKLLPHHVRYTKAAICSSEWWLLEQSCCYTLNRSALWDLKAFVQMEETKSQRSWQTVMKS